MPEIKPCPFCGGAAEVQEVDIVMFERFEDREKRFYVQCQCCNAASDLHTRRNAIARWNMRTPEEGSFDDGVSL